MERTLTDLDKLNGEEFVQRAAGMKEDEIIAEVARFRDDFLARIIAYLEERYRGAVWGFAATLHSLCILEAAVRFREQWEGGLQ